MGDMFLAHPPARSSPWRLPNKVITAYIRYCMAPPAPIYPRPQLSPVLTFVKFTYFDSVCAPEATTAQRDPRFQWSASQARTKTTQALRSATSALTVITASSRPTMSLSVPRVHSARRVPSSARSSHAPTAHTRTRQDWLLRRSVVSARLEGAYPRSITFSAILMWSLFWSYVGLLFIVPSFFFRASLRFVPRSSYSACDVL